MKKDYEKFIRTWKNSTWCYWHKYAPGDRWPDRYIVERRRFENDRLDMYEERIRWKNRSGSLPPNPWDDLPRSRGGTFGSKSWKKGHKVRKQYMVNLNKKVDRH